MLAKESDEAEPYHLHNNVSITIKEHKKQSDGSCITTYYDGKQCTECGKLWKGDVIKEVKLAKCTH